MTDFNIDFLDHVAIRVKDLEVSALWYMNVLGLKKTQPPEWTPFPIFLMSGRTGIALFPANEDDSKNDPSSKNVKIDHFAFNVNKENFLLAKKKYTELELEFEFQDHHYFHSLYTKDPDGHTVELTTLIADEGFYPGHD